MIPCDWGGMKRSPVAGRSMLQRSMNRGTRLSSPRPPRSDPRCAKRPERVRDGLRERGNPSLRWGRVLRCLETRPLAVGSLRSPSGKRASLVRPLAASRGTNSLAASERVGYHLALPALSTAPAEEESRAVFSYPPVPLLRSLGTATSNVCMVSMKTPGRLGRASCPRWCAQHRPQSLTHPRPVGDLESP